MILNRFLKGSLAAFHGEYRVSESIHSRAGFFFFLLFLPSPPPPPLPALSPLFLLAVTPHGRDPSVNKQCGWWLFCEAPQRMRSLSYSVQH